MKSKIFSKVPISLPILLIFVAFVTLIIAIPRLIVIQKINCSSQFGVCQDYLEKEIVRGEGKNLLQAEEYLKKLLTREIKVLRFSVRYKFPDKIEINLIERKPVFAVTKEGTNEFDLYDIDGVSVGKVVESQLPTITLKEDLDTKKLTFAGDIMADLYNIYSVRSGTVSGDTLTVVGIEGKNVLFTLEGDRDILLGLLKLILSRLYSMSENSRIKIIDLRFKNPILR